MNHESYYVADWEPSPSFAHLGYQVIDRASGYVVATFRTADYKSAQDAHGDALAEARALTIAAIRERRGKEDLPTFGEAIGDLGFNNATGLLGKQ